MRRYIFLILGLSAALGLVYSRFYYVGSFIDDAFYTLRAQSLFHARSGISLYPQAMATYAPGLSLFLSPFVACLGHHWGALKLVMIALGSASCLAAARLFRPWLAPGSFLIFFSVYALNPCVAKAASFVMSDSLFVFLTLSMFCLLRRAIRLGEPRLGWFLGAWLGWAMVVRPTGLILAPAVAAGLIYSRRWKTAAKVLGVALAIWGAVLLQNYHIDHSPSGYWPQWKESVGYVGRPLALVDNWNRVTNLFFVVVPLGIQLPYSVLGFAASAAIVIAMLGLMGQGIIGIARRKKKDRALIFSVVVFCLGYYGVHSLWALIDMRYALPILPFLLAFSVAGTHSVWRRARGSSLRSTAVVVMAALFIVLGNARMVGRESNLAGRPARRFPGATLEWIRRHTPPDATLSAARAPTVFLYTGRRCVFGPSGPVHDREELRYQLLRGGVAYVLDQPVIMQGLPKNAVHPDDANDSIRQRLSWTASWPEAFLPVYRNASEGTTIYELAQGESFLKAFDLYSAARRELDQSRFEAGFRGLDLALAAQPGFVKALDAYGAASVLSGRHLAAGESKLKQALRIDPDGFWTWLNLARLYRKEGRMASARDAFDHARAALAQSSYLAGMRPVVAQEAAEMGARLN